MAYMYTGGLCPKGVPVFRYYFRLQVYGRLGISLVEVFERFLVSRAERRFLLLVPSIQWENTK